MILGRRRVDSSGIVARSTENESLFRLEAQRSPVCRLPSGHVIALQRHETERGSDSRQIYWCTGELQPPWLWARIVHNDRANKGVEHFARHTNPVREPEQKVGRHCFLSQEVGTDCRRPDQVVRPQEAEESAEFSIRQIAL